MVRGRVASKAEVILELRVPDAARSTLLRPEGPSSMDAVFLVALPADIFTAVPAELNIRVDYMVGAVRLHPSTTIMGEVLLLGSRRMDPGIHRLFSRTRR